MELLIEKFSLHLPSFICIFVRIATLFTMAPFFNSPLIPVKIRILSAASIAIIILPFVPLTNNIDMLSISWIYLILQEMLIGLCIGIVFQIIFQIFIAAGQIIALQTGLGFSTLVDPQYHESLPIISEFYMIATTLLFLAFNGHLQLLQAIIQSFELLPIGNTLVHIFTFDTILQFSSQIFSSAVSVALPAISALLMVNITFGIISKSVPQVNIMSIGFGITLLAGLIIMAISFPSILNHSESLFAEGFSTINSMFKVA